MSPVMVNPSRFEPSGGGSYSAQVLARPSLLAYYRLGEASGATMVDSSGNGRNGTYHGPPTLGTTGLVTGDTDTAATFSGSSQYGTLASASWMNPATLSVIAWIKMSGGAGTIRGIMGHCDNGTDGPLMFRVNSSNQLQAVLWPSVTVLNGATSLSVGTRYHVAMTYDGASLKLYVNGVQDASVSKTGAPFANNDFFVGILSIAAGCPFPGVIDEVQYYGSGLSATDIAADYAAG